MKVQTEVISQGNLFVSPAEFFCGDKVLLSYSFSSTSDAMTELEQFLHGETLTFATSDQLQKIMKFENPDVYISEISVSCIKSTSEASNFQTQANVKIDCIFWKSGQVEIPAIKLELETTQLEIQIPSVTVSSILEKTGTTSIRGYKGPEIIPGSTYLVWASVLLTALVLALIILAIVKCKKIAKFFKDISIKRKFKKSYKKANLNLILLKKNSNTLNDENFCLKIQTTIRDYFSVRISNHIYNMTTEEITKYLTDKVAKYVEENLTGIFYEVMYKCDTIRFSRKDKGENLLQENERLDLIQKTQSILNIINKGIPFDADI